MRKTLMQAHNVCAQASAILHLLQDIDRRDDIGEEDVSFAIEAARHLVEEAATPIQESA